VGTNRNGSPPSGRHSGHSSRGWQEQSEMKSRRIGGEHTRQ
jgi:hypothetical protein